MSFKMERITPAQRQEIVDLLNESFGRNGAKADFEKILPHLFEENALRLSDHFAVYPVENGVRGEMCAAMSNIEMQYKIGNETLKMAISGNVGVLPSARGKGLMQVLFDKINQVLVEEEFDFSYLHGDRTRYNYFGFELCGIEYQFRFRMVDLPKHFKPSDKFRFEKLRDRMDLVPQAMAVTAAQKSYIYHPEAEFVRTMETGTKEPLVVFRNDEFYGTFAFDGDGMHFIAMQDYTDFSELVHAFLLSRGLPSLQCNIPAFDKVMLDNCMKYCGGWKIGVPASFKIINFPHVVQAFLQVKADSQPLYEGSLTLDSDLFGKYCITVSKGVVSVTPFEGEAKFKVQGFDVYDFLFNFTPNTYGEYDPAVSSWLPIPLYAPSI